MNVTNVDGTGVIGATLPERLWKDRLEPLALDPLRPIAPRPRRIEDAAWLMDPLSLDPLSPLHPLGASERPK